MGRSLADRRFQAVALGSPYDDDARRLLPLRALRLGKSRVAQPGPPGNESATPGLVGRIRSLRSDATVCLNSCRTREDQSISWRHPRRKGMP
jgi:hypothetical protein